LRTLFAPAQAAALRQVLPVAELVEANAALTAAAGAVAVLGAALEGWSRAASTPTRPSP
jgi:hypothetical protein